MSIRCVLRRSGVESRGERRGLMVLAAAAMCAAPAGAISPLQLGPEIVLSNASITTLGQAGVSIARAANGWALAVWSDDRTGDQDVYGALLTPSGTLATAVGGFHIVGSSGTNEGDPRVAVCGNTFLVVYGDGVSDSDTTDLFALRLDTTGAVLDTTPIVISNQPGVQHNVRSPASDGVDTFLVPFRDASATIWGEIRCMRVRASTGAPLDPAGGRVIEAGVPGVLRKNAAASYGAGRFFMTWDDARDGCRYPGEAGCIDIYGAFIDPATGGLLGPSFPTTSAFSCQEGSRSAFDGLNFLVAHSDERATNCVTADVYGERVDTTGALLDAVDPTGMVGGLEVASDPAAFPGSVQGGVTVIASPSEGIVTYGDLAAAAGQMSMRARRVNAAGRLEWGDSPGLPGRQIATGAPPQTGALARGEICAVGPFQYGIAYALNDVPTVRFVQFTTPFQESIFHLGTASRAGPRGVAVDAAGRVYVADTYADRIQVFHPDGSPLFQFGSGGSGNGQFASPFGVAVDSLGRIVVADSGNQRIQVFSASGQFLFKFGSGGTGNGQFRSPFGVAVDQANNIYVADTDNHRVQVFSPNGQFRLKFGTLGTGSGQFRAARAVAVDSAGTIYVADRDNSRVQWFDNNGVYRGRSIPRLDQPRGVAVDSTGKIHVAESVSDRVSVLSPPSGGAAPLYYRYGMNGGGPGQFRYTSSIAVDASGRAFVVDASNNRIQVFGSVP